MRETNYRGYILKFSFLVQLFLVSVFVLSGERAYSEEPSREQTKEFIKTLSFKYSSVDDAGIQFVHDQVRVMWGYAIYEKYKGGGVNIITRTIIADLADFDRITLSDRGFKLLCRADSYCVKYRRQASKVEKDRISENRSTFEVPMSPNEAIKVRDAFLHLYKLDGNPLKDETVDEDLF